VFKPRVKLDAELLLAFSDLYLKGNFDEAVQTPAAHLEWWRLVCLPRRFVAIAAPRGHAKSTAITHTFVLANVCFRTKRHVLIVSDTESQAGMFLGNIKRELEENEDLREAFGIKRFIKDSETELIVLFEDGTKSRIIARGGAQKIRGTNWLGKRPDLIVCDDLENDEAVLNQDRRDKFLEWFMKTLIPCGSKSATVRVVGTILHEDSLLNGLMPDLLEDPGIVIEPLRIYTTTKQSWLAVLYRAHPDFDDFSEILWPEQWSEERLREERQGYTDRGLPEGYAQEYLNNPQASQGAYFEEDDLLPFEANAYDPATKDPEEFYIGVDLAISTKDRTAFTAFTVAGVDPHGTLRIREVVRKRIGTYEIIDTFFVLNEKYKHKSATGTIPAFLVENENIAKSIGPVLYKDMDERQEYLNLETMPPIHDKTLRARSFQGRVRAHRVEFDHNASWWPVLKNELMLFPKGRFADQVDALAWIGYHLADIHNAPSHRDLAEWERDRELEDADFDFYDERDVEYEDDDVNLITGYY
jgi:predicted phage terminase large subunit-like protein